MLEYCRSGAFKDEHHRKAVQHYNKALVKAQRTLATARPEKKVVVTLISGLLFHTFEWFHGNTGAVDQIVPLLMGLLQDQTWANLEPVQRVFRGAMFMCRSSIVFQSIAPHFPGIQQSMWGSPDLVLTFCLPTPLELGPESSLQELVAVWWRFITSITNLYVGPAFLSEATPAQISFLLAAASSWEREARSRAAVPNTCGDSLRLLDTMAKIANQVSQRIRTCSLSASKKGQPDGSFVALSNPEYAALLEFYKISRIQQIDYEYHLVTEAFNHPALPTLVYAARHCIRRTLRLEALELCRSLLQPVASLSIKSTYMALKALADVEGEALANRYVWTESRWNDDYTALSITLAPADPVVDRELLVTHLILSVDDYGV